MSKMEKTTLVLVFVSMIAGTMLVPIEAARVNNMVAGDQDISAQSPKTGGAIQNEPASPTGVVTMLLPIEGGSVNNLVARVQDIPAQSPKTGGAIQNEPASPTGVVTNLSFPVPCAVTQFVPFRCTKAVDANPQITEFCSCTMISH